jgi:hypothetical protein
MAVVETANGTNLVPFTAVALISGPGKTPPAAAVATE